MKTTIDIPDAVMAEIMHSTRAKTKKEAVLTALDAFNRQKRLHALNKRVRGTFRDFMTPADLQAMRSGAKWGTQS
jgi:Arc/MetJ family transcription regulator